MAVLNRLLRGTLVTQSPPAPAKPEPPILDKYVASAPTPQNAVDIFPGEWSSEFPAPSREQN